MRSFFGLMTTALNGKGICMFNDKITFPPFQIGFGLNTRKKLTRKCKSSGDDPMLSYTRKLRVAAL